MQPELDGALAAVADDIIEIGLAGAPSETGGGRPSTHREVLEPRFVPGCTPEHKLGTAQKIDR
jgi:hypothetical protein